MGEFDPTWNKFAEESPFMAWYIFFATACRMVIDAMILALAVIMMKGEKNG